MTRVRSRACMALATLLALPLVATIARAQDSRPIVAVLYFENNSIGKDAADYAGIGRGIADLLITDLASSTSVRVVERERIEAVLAEQNLARDGRIDPETAVRIGRILGAAHVITGGFMNTGRGQTVLTARTVDMETAAIGNPQRVQTTTDDVLGLITQLNGRISTSLRLPARERRTGDAGGAGGTSGAMQAAAQQVAVAKDPAPAARAGKLDVRTALLYSKALAAQDAGDRTKAVEFYNQVLDRFPNLEAARQNSDRLQGAGT